MYLPQITTLNNCNAYLSRKSLSYHFNHSCMANKTDTVMARTVVTEVPMQTVLTTIGNCTEPDQTAHIRAVWSGSVEFPIWPAF